MSDNDLARVAQGKYAQRLEFLRQEAEKRPAEEFYLLLNPSEVERASEEHFALWAHRLESCRNGLILLPVFMTWFSLGLAALAYIQAYNGSPDPFLKQWADGFPAAHLPFPVPDFISVAMIDAALIFFLLLLTLGAQIIESRAHKRAASLRTWLDDELYKLASTSLVKALGEGPGNKQPAWAVEVHTAISHLTQALEGVEKLVQSSQATLENLVKTSQTVFSNIADTSQERIEGSVREFSNALSDQREAVREFMSGTIEVRRAVDKLEHIYVAGEHIYQGLNDTLPRIDASFSTIATRQDAAASALETLSKQTNQATHAIGTIATQFTQTQLIQNMYQITQQMRQTAEMMGQIAVYMNNAINQQIQLQIRLEQKSNISPPYPTNSAYQNRRTDEPRPAASPASAKKTWFKSLRKHA